jgi:integrase/recombinase XerD
MKIEVKYEPSVHNGKDVIFIRFEKNDQLNTRVKKLVGVKWSQSNKAWYVPDNTAYRSKFGIKQKETTTEKFSQIDSLNKQAFIRYTETLKLKSYSLNTIKTYQNEFAQLLYFLKDSSVNEQDSETIRAYFIYCTEELKLSENTLHSRINAVKFYFEKVLNREKFFFTIPRPKKPFLLPNVLAINQIEKLFSKIHNLKHKTMLYLAYSAGLRISEVVNLKIADIHSDRMVINVKGAKGKKDRTVGLSEGILVLLRKYYISYKPAIWLFEGQYKTEPYSTRSLQQIFNRAKKEARVLQSVTFHSLRHSYATHLHERGTDIKLIQELLGHNDIKTTLRYTHVSTQKIETIKSPFDQLNLKED